MPAVHFEIHVTDTARARSFYGAILGWTFQSMPGGDYHLIKGEGIGVGEAVSGAMSARNAPEPVAGGGPRGAALVFSVKNVDVLYAKALEMGGSEALPPTDFEGVGRIAYCEDGEGNIFGMVEPPAEGN